MFSTPILFLVFNRLETTQKVFEQIRKIQPQKLYLAADGPRKGIEEDQSKCTGVREFLANAIDWPCEVKTLFRDENLGCGIAVSQAITWFFEQEEMGIILEDDCLPDLSFFTFAQVLLNKYLHDDRIMVISGNNFQDGHMRGNASYYFSRFPNIWGWATWRRAWKLYDFEMNGLDDFLQDSLFHSILQDEVQKTFWLKYLLNTRSGEMNTWDIQLAYCVWRNNGLSVSPNKNLVSNIGFASKEATHTSGTSHLSNILLEKMGEMTHPTKVFPDRQADDYMFYHAYTNGRDSILLRLKKIVHKICLKGFGIR